MSINQLQIAKRGKLAPDSPIRKLTPLAQQAKKRGIKVYHLNIGQPDFHIPDKIKKELLKLTSQIKILPYSPSQGEPELLQAWVKYYADSGIKITKEEVIITTGGSEAIILALSVVADIGDNFLTFEPFYANYLGFGALLGLEVIPVTLDKNRGYHLPDKEEILAKINKRTKAIFFTNPNNPTGTVFTKKEIETVLKIAREKNLFIISDETYRGITFNGVKSYSLLEVAPEKDQERIVVVDSLSKRMNITGARIGCVASKNKKVMQAVLKFAQTRLSVAILDQQMVVSMLRDCQSYIKNLAKEYKKRRDVFLQELIKRLKLKIHYPEGAFYIMLQLPVLDAEDFSRWLLTDFSHNGETVMVAPGNGFYASKGKGKSEIRVAFVLKGNELKKAARILAIALNKYRELKS